MPKIKSTRTRRKPCRVRVPASFDPKLHLPIELRKHADSARYLLHRIIWSNVQKKQNLDGFVPLKFQYLREVIPDRILKSLKDALIDSGMIECDNHYIEGHKSHGYKLGRQSCNDRIVEIQITEQATENKIIKLRRAKDRRIRLDVHCWLRSNFKELDIDLPLALAKLSGHHAFETVKIPAEEIAAKNVSVSVCRYGRFHTPLTRLSRQVRCFLNVDGEPLINLDIRNSQPLFLALLMMNYRKRDNKKFGLITFKDNVVNPYKNIDSIIEQTVTSFTSKKENSFHHSLSVANTNRKAIEKGTQTQYSQSLRTTTSCPQDNTLIKKHLQQDELFFLGLCEDGSLYKHLASIADIPSKSWAKENFFEVLFSKNNFQSKLKSAFTEEFPNVAEVIRVHKRRNYQFLAQLLQNIESNFMINNVCRTIMNEMPEAPIFTIHDSIMTTKPYVDRITHVMKAEFASLGLSPRIKPEDYGATAKSDSEGLTEPSVANVEGGLGLQAACLIICKKFPT